LPEGQAYAKVLITLHYITNNDKNNKKMTKVMNIMKRR
jgi:hypothetical protein